MSNNEKLLQTIEAKIYIFRGQKVMLDSDLAKLYGVETKRLNEQIKRNVERFPLDFMFQLTKEEVENQRSQIATFEEEVFKRKYLPYVFTENGVAMLSSILNSAQAIEVNIAIMRIFTRLRSFLFLEKNITERMDNLEEGTNHLFKIVFERLDTIDKKLDPHLPEQRSKIGLMREKES